MKRIISACIAIACLSASVPAKALTFEIDLGQTSLTMPQTDVFNSIPGLASIPLNGQQIQIDFTFTEPQIIIVNNYPPANPIATTLLFDTSSMPAGTVTGTELAGDIYAGGLVQMTTFQPASGFGISGSLIAGGLHLNGFLFDLTLPNDPGVTITGESLDISSPNGFFVATPDGASTDALMGLANDRACQFFQCGPNHAQGSITGSCGKVNGLASVPAGGKAFALRQRNRWQIRL